jgi:TatD-related deoxyribonuclease
MDFYCSSLLKGKAKDLSIYIDFKFMLPISDGHLHSNPVTGLGARAIANKFKEVSGWFIALVSLPPSHYGLKDELIDDHYKAIEGHIKECQEARSVGLKVKCIAGFHPSIHDKLFSKGVKPETSFEMAIRVLERVRQYIKDGKLDGIGEVGRPHYKVEPIFVIIANRVMEEALNISRELDCPVHLHLESYGLMTVKDVDMTIRRLGNKNRKRIVFHHSRAGITENALSLGYSATVTAKIQVLSEVIRRTELAFTFESDFIDDPKRPGVVMYPWEISTTVIRLINEKSLTEDRLNEILIDSIEKTYDVTY